MNRWPPKVSLPRARAKSALPLQPAAALSGLRALGEVFCKHERKVLLLVGRPQRPRREGYPPSTPLCGFVDAVDGVDDLQTAKKGIQWQVEKGMPPLGAWC